MTTDAGTISLLSSVFDEVGGFGPIVPTPEPGTLTLVALGVAALARRRR